MTLPPDYLPPDLELVRGLAELPAAERRAVVAAAESAARSGPRVVARWETLRAAIGVVRGEPADAVEDTALLHDD